MDQDKTLRLTVLVHDLTDANVRFGQTKEEERLAASELPASSVRKECNICSKLEVDFTLGVGLPDEQLDSKLRC